MNHRLLTFDKNDHIPMDRSNSNPVPIQYAASGNSDTEISEPPQFIEYDPYNMAAADSDLIEMHLRDSDGDSEPDAEHSNIVPFSSSPEFPSDRVKPRQRRSDASEERFVSSVEHTKQSAAEHSNDRSAVAAADSDLIEMHLRDSDGDSEPDAEHSDIVPFSSSPEFPSDRVKPRQRRSDASEERLTSSFSDSLQVSHDLTELSRNPEHSEIDNFVVERRIDCSSTFGDCTISSFQEQKHWISSVLSAASAAGEETIEFQFSEDKHKSEGCASCGPDFSDLDVVLGPNQTKSQLGTQIWSSHRSCVWLQSSCWKFYNSALFRWLFRGNDGDFPKIEPAQNFRCGWKMLQERGCVLAFLFLFLLILSLTAFPAFLRIANQIHIACIDYRRIQKFTISCNGCKVQITNHADWAGFFAPCNVNLFFPTDASYNTPHMFNKGRYDRCIPELVPSFCDYSSGSCYLQIQHLAESVPFSSIENLLSMEVQDYLVRCFR
jgi:hypothetical protein